MPMNKIERDLNQALAELYNQFTLNENHILIIGCSTSEVIGEQIGTAGNETAAAEIFQVLADYRERYGFHLAFQGCEHINRSVIVERSTFDRFNLNEVTVVPVREAGGAMAALAYRSFKDPIVVEQIQAHAGIDIGGTLIGMHLRPVAVPFKGSVTKIGEANLIMAITRPKLIGGERAQYKL